MRKFLLWSEANIELCERQDTSRRKKLVANLNGAIPAASALPLTVRFRAEPQPPFDTGLLMNLLPARRNRHG